MSDAPNPEFDPKPFLKTLTHRPGVYRMLDEGGQVLYVGKARDLKKRVSSYFSRAANLRIQSMVSQIRGIEVTVTHTEAEALLLENNLIKSLKPRYNVLLRDDKSYPFIHLSGHEFPRLAFHRGARDGGGRYFGPYPSAGAVRESLQLIQKLFPVRQCEDSYFANRSRPCLQYQIKRCSGPCVGLVSPAAYDLDVADTELFLQGKATDVVDRLVERMEAASAQLEFEEAARIRDQISAVRRVQDKQYVSGERGDLDILAAEVRGGSTCVQVFFIRGGRNLGNKALFPKLRRDGEEPETVISAVVAQFYLGREVPPEILLSHEPADFELLQEALTAQAGRRVRLQVRPRGERARWLAMARQNASLALASRLAGGAGMSVRLESLREALDLDEVPGRMECFDISHTRGDQTVASCVVFNQEGPLKSDYRRFNIQDITPGDDYAAMAQALRRRYTRLKSGEAPLPDILFIDGGKGQLNAAAEIMEELAVAGVLLVGVAKGADRRVGMEQLFKLGDQAAIILPEHSPGLHLVQQIRDEAHRFAITGHRQRRAKATTKSVLDEIPGIGPKRRRRLLEQFGGLQGLERAGVEDLATVEGISRKLAQQIYEVFHGGK